MKITIIGNAAGGKSRLARKLSQTLQIPCTHVDSIQFDANLKIMPLANTRLTLKNITAADAWIIDGYGPLDLIEERFRLADKIIFIDLPLYRHFWWLGKRQITSLWRARAELPSGARENRLAHIKKVIRAMRSMHKQMRPELIRILSRPHFAGKLAHIRSVAQLNEFSLHLK